MKTINFVLENNNNFYKLELAKSLLHFTEFDFTYFWEQCITAGKIAYKTGTLPSDKLSIARNAVAKCHPYVEACLNTSFDSITVDCIIAYICSSEHIGLEELWSRCISPKNNYEQTIFRRISEYKTGRAINRWVNIVRMNEYARTKMEFIYDTHDGPPLTQAEAEVRREYFDLSFSVAANEIGYSGSEMPYVRRYSPALLPGASFKIGKISKSIYHRMADALGNAVPSQQKGAVMSDQNAMDVFSYIKNLPLPGEMDMKFTREAVETLPDSVIYMPTGFKGIIDLEFDLLAEEDIMLVKCSSCGKYFIKDDSYDRPYCDRVGPSGKTCREADSEFLRMKAEAEAAAAAKAAAEAAEREAAARAAAEAEAKAAEEAAARAAEEAALIPETEEYEEDIPGTDHPARTPVLPTIPSETEKRSQRIYNALYRRVGRIMDDSEFKEWSQYLSNLKRNVKNGDCSLSELDDFLDYSEGLYSEKKTAARQRTAGSGRSRRNASDVPVQKITASSQEISKFTPAVFEKTLPTEKHSLSEKELYRAAEEAGYSPDDDIHTKYIHGSEDSAAEYSEAPPVRTIHRENINYPPFGSNSSQPAARNYPQYEDHSTDDYIPDRGAPIVPGKISRYGGNDDGGYRSDSTDKQYRPFTPKKYASVYDAMMDAAISDSADIGSDDGYIPSPAPSDRVRIRKPDWEYLKK